MKYGGSYKYLAGELGGVSDNMNNSDALPKTIELVEDDDDDSSSVIDLTRSDAAVGAKRMLDLVDDEEEVQFAAEPQGVPRPVFAAKQPKSERMVCEDNEEEFNPWTPHQDDDSSGVDLHRFFSRKGVRLEDAISLCSAFVRYGNATKKAGSLRNKKGVF